MKLKIQIGLIT